MSLDETCGFRMEVSAGERRTSGRRRLCPSSRRARLQEAAEGALPPQDSVSVLGIHDLVLQAIEITGCS